MAVPGSGNGKIPADFLQDGAVLKHLPGLLTVLRDGGFTEQEAFDWLFREDDSLPGTPGAGAARRPAHRGHPPRPGHGVLMAGPAMGHLTYLALLAGCLVVTAPLELVLRVRVYARWRRLLLAARARVRRVRRLGALRDRPRALAYDAAQTLGVRLPGGIPLEEVLFFLVVPVCAVLALEAVRKVTGWDAGYPPRTDDRELLARSR